MATATELLNEIIANLQSAVVDAEKADNGNSAAGTRVRGAAQTAKAKLQELRISIQESKNARAAQA